MNTPRGEATIFAEALRLPPAERDRYLDEATHGDPALRQRVESLLNSYDEADFLEAPAAPDIRATLQVTISVTEKAGDTIGRYKLLQQIGEGGCGIVYMADQTEPVRRRVALKVIKLGMDTKQVVARFEAERQALAMMDHPNIAKVLDGGTTDTGRPYFVMELVRGTKITEFSDEKKLSARERLELFIPVCQAVQHAHQKGIIHRDLKPSNILVTFVDGRAVPKVIDFGIAKATNNQRLTDLTVFTEFEQFIGTPAYMSPEQAEMSSLELDTRTDIYSLGVVLYELLTGTTPFEPAELLRAGLDEIRRTIREQEPAKPSTRLESLAKDNLTTVAAARRTEAPRLVSAIRGDLDWIIMKCLEKDRNRRYESASAFSEDLRRHLGTEPILARPPSAMYSLQKSIRRHRFAFGAATAVATALLIGLAASTSMFLRERQARTRAETAEQQESALRKEAQNAQALARQMEQEAKLEAARQKQVADFAFEMFKDVQTAFAKSADRSLLQEVIDRTVARAATAFKDQPGSAALFYSQMGDHHWRGSRFKEAEAVWREAVRLFTIATPTDRAQAAWAALNLAYLLYDQDRVQETESVLLQAEGWMPPERMQGPRGVDPQAFRRLLARAQARLGKDMQAEENLRICVQVETRRLGSATNQSLLRSWSSAVLDLAEHQEKTREPSSAEATYREAIRLRPDWITGRLELAAFLRRNGRPGDAFKELETVYTLAAPKLDDPDAFEKKTETIRTFAEELINVAWDAHSSATNAFAATAAKMGEQVSLAALRAQRKENSGVYRANIRSYLTNVLARAQTVVLATAPAAERDAGMMKQTENLALSSALFLGNSDVHDLNMLFRDSNWDLFKAIQSVERVYSTRKRISPEPNASDFENEWREQAANIASLRSIWLKTYSGWYEATRPKAASENERLFAELVPAARKVATRFPAIYGSALKHQAESFLNQNKAEQAEPLLLGALDAVKRQPLESDRLIMELADTIRAQFKRYDNAQKKPEQYQAATKLFSELNMPFGKPEQPDPKNICINLLRQIDGAKEQWAMENKKSKGAAPTDRELWGLNGYIKREPKCPSGGIYSPRGVDEPPVCSIHGSP